MGGDQRSVLYRAMQKNGKKGAVAARPDTSNEFQVQKTLTNAD
jgi:hypothetical protein